MYKDLKNMVSGLISSCNDSVSFEPVCIAPYTSLSLISKPLPLQCQAHPKIAEKHLNRMKEKGRKRKEAKKNS